MKHVITNLILVICTLSGWAQSITCQIEGTTTDTKTTKLYLVESGADIRTQGNVISISVIDGKFSHTLKTDDMRYYELIADNQYEEGSWTPAYFISENQKVHITMGGNKDKAITKGTGKETKMIQQLNDELDAVYNPLFNAADARRDSLDAILQKEVEGMDADARRAYIDDLLSDDSKNPHAAIRKQLEEDYEAVYMKWRIATVMWLEKHPCIYGLFEMKNSLSSHRAQTAPFTPYHISSYKNTYSKKYEGHPYHKSIQDALKSLDLVPGNKYIDYEVTHPDGKQVALSSLFTGKVIYIDLWASWCGPCRKHAKALIPIFEKYKDKGFQVIGIARESAEEDMAKALTKDGYPWISLLELNDKNQVWLKNGISNAGGGGFLIDEHGTILSVYPEAEETERILEKILVE